jgi:hypothetical protein
VGLDGSARQIGQSGLSGLKNKEQAEAAVQELSRMPASQVRKKLDKVIDRLWIIVPIVREHR